MTSTSKAIMTLTINNLNDSSTGWTVTYVGPGGGVGNGDSVGRAVADIVRSEPIPGYSQRRSPRFHRLAA